MTLPAIQPLVDAFFTWVWKTSLSTVVLIALVLVAQFVFRKVLSARWLYALWLCVLLRLIMPVLPQSSLSIFNLSSHLQNVPNDPFRRRGPGLEFSLQAPPVPLTPSQATAVAPTQTAFRLTSDLAAAKPVRFLGAVPYLWLLGALSYWTVVLAQHRKLSRWLKSQAPLAGDRLISIITEAGQLLHLKHRPETYETSCLPAPSLFGFWKPRLLLPRALLENLSDAELKLIVLHELIHVKRCDVLLNWLMIALQSLHWFNPFVWLAMSRTRAARELACDAAVLSHLAAEERQVYGGTLIKLVAAFSKSPLTPGLIPIINRKKQMHRRITMIANFKPTPRLVTIASAVLLVAIACFTFTRAAEKPATAPPAAVDKPRPQDDLPKETANYERRIAALEKALAEQDRAVRSQQMDLDEMRKKLGILQSDESANGGAASDIEALRKMETLRLEAKADYSQIEALLNSLAKLSRAELKKTILTASPDALLSSLFAQEAAAEQKLAELSVKFSGEHPEVRSTKLVLERINQQINDRVDGILGGLKTKTESIKAKMSQLQAELAKAKAVDIETAIERRPYFQLKRDLETLQLMRERLYLRLMQEKIDAAVPKQ